MRCTRQSRDPTQFYRSNTYIIYIYSNTRARASAFPAPVKNNILRVYVYIYKYIVHTVRKTTTIHTHTHTNTYIYNKYVIIFFCDSVYNTSEYKCISPLENIYSMVYITLSVVFLPFICPTLYIYIYNICYAI